MPSRLPEWSGFLSYALERGYQFLTVRDWLRGRRMTGVSEKQKYVILRHDVDTDVPTAMAMFLLEKELGIRSSFYFRLQTVDVALMRLIEQCGGEASYHFEEIATVAKQKGLCDRVQVFEHMQEIRGVFRQNFTQLRESVGVPLLTVAAHGDFVNRLLKVYNQELLSDELRYDLGIEGETYDPALNEGIASRYSDRPFPSFWSPSHPCNDIDLAVPVIYLLVHPRHWYARAHINLADNWQRALEGIRYRLATRARA